MLELLEKAVLLVDGNGALGKSPRWQGTAGRDAVKWRILFESRHFRHLIEDPGTTGRGEVGPPEFEVPLADAGDEKPDGDP